MTCKREQFEVFEREARTKHEDKICDGMFEDLVARIKEYAQQRRLEEIMRKTKGDPMDIGLAAHAQVGTIWRTTILGTTVELCGCVGKGKRGCKRVHS